MAAHCLMNDTVPRHSIKAMVKITSTLHKLLDARERRDLIPPPFGLPVRNRRQDIYSRKPAVPSTWASFRLVASWGQIIRVGELDGRLDAASSRETNE